MAKLKPYKTPPRKRINLQPIVDAFQTPDGFIRETGEGRADRQSHYTEWGGKRTEGRWLRLTSPSVVIVLNYPDKSTLCHAGSIIADGHTYYLDPINPDGWYTFDRTGVDDSFYLSAPCDWDKDGLDLTKKVQEQLDRIRERLAKSLAAGPRIDIPHTGFSVTQGGKVKITERLLGGQGYSLTPSGFGRGLNLRTRRTSHWDKYRPDLAAFFGVPEVWVSEFDHD
jgi:hypothetical protein